MSVKDAMKIQQLEGDLRARHHQVSMMLNLIEQVKLALAEDDVDEAKRLLTEFG